MPRSGLKAVEKVPPGSLAVAEGGAVRVERYWRPRPAAGLGTDEEWVERVRDEVTAAVRRRLVSDVPLGALLSGGLDSSIVVSAMAAASPEPVRTFTIGFPDSRYDERPYARAVAERFGTTHEELEVDPGPELLDRVAEAFDEPFGDEAALPMLLVCEATRRHVTVALVGDGGDEAFGGYERYRAHALACRIPRLAGGARDARRSAWSRPRAASRARRSSAPGASSTWPRSRGGTGTPGSSRCSRSSSAAGSGRTRRGPRRPSRCSLTTPTCASSTSSRTSPATCSRRATSPRWPSRSSSARRSSITG